MVSMDNAYDIVLEDGDYTIGKLLEYMLYSQLFMSPDRQLTFVSFYKNHPHDTSGILRVAFVETTTKDNVRLTIQATCETLKAIFEKLGTLF